MNLTVQILAAPSLLSNLDSDDDIQIIGRFDNELDALAFLLTNKPAIILLDYAVENENTEILIKSLLSESPQSKVILIGENLPDDIILRCLVNAIYGYLEWHDVDTFLYKAILSVGKGEAWVSRRLVGLLIGKLRG